MNRKQIIAGNWKMNKSFKEGLELTHQIVDASSDNGHEIILAPPFILLQAVAAAISETPFIKLAAQNCHQATSGAYTGEISVGMLQSVGVQYVILGHSERRQYFNENNALLAQKVKAVLAAGLQPIFCVGETLDLREADKHVDFVINQLKEGLFDLDENAFSNVVIAYEPIWAIGTGVTASPEQAQEMHAYIRNAIREAYNSATANATTLLYGGSVKPKNASDLFAKADVDGGLVGGASLKATDFLAICDSLYL